MKKLAVACAAVVMLVLPLCAHAQKVTVDWDHNVHNFAALKTYQWVKPTRTTSNPLMDQRIVAAIDAQLAAKGLQQTTNHPDVLVTYHTGVRAQRSSTVMGTGGWRFGGGMASVQHNVSEAGTLIVNIVNGDNKDLIWRGTATDTLSGSPDKNSKKIDKAVAKMFKKYPPPPAK